MFPVLSTALDLLSRVADDLPADRLDDPTPCVAWSVTQVLLHAAGDQHAWASAVGSAPRPTYNPFEPPTRIDGSIQDLIGSAVSAARSAWDGLDGGTVDTPLPPVPQLAADVAASACALDAAIHAWDLAVATGAPSPLTDELAVQLQPGADAVVEPLRGFAYGPALPANAGDGAASALLRHVGRDPRWTRGDS